MTFRLKFAVFVLCELLAVLVSQVGVIQDNAGVAESPLRSPFVVSFLSLTFLFFFPFCLASCKTCVAHVLPRNPFGFVAKKKS